MKANVFCSLKKLIYSWFFITLIPGFLSHIWAVQLNPSKSWEIIGQFDSSQISQIFPLSDDEIWITMYDDFESIIYQFRDRKWTKQEPVPNVGGLVDIVFVNYNKGWAIGSSGVLEYDGVFWRKVEGLPGHGKALRNNISVVSTDEVWFSNGYKYKNGNYDTFTFPADRYIADIIMKNSESGVALTAKSSSLSEPVFYNFNGLAWTPTLEVPYHSGGNASYYGQGFPRGIAVNDSLDIFFDNGAGSGGFRTYERIYKYHKSQNALNEIDRSAFPLRDSGSFKVLGIDQDKLVWMRVFDHGSYGGNADDDPYVGWLDDKLNILSLEPSLSHITLLKFGSAYAWALSIDQTTIYRANVVFPEIKLSSREIKFDNVPYTELPEINRQTRGNLSISNKGSGNLEIFQIENNSEMYRIQPTTGIVAPGDSLNIAIVFLPTTDGKHDGLLTIVSNDPNTPNIKVSLSGVTKGSIIPPTLDISNEKVDFGAVILDSNGNHFKKVVKLSNKGEALLHINSLSFEPDYFSLSDNLPQIPIVLAQDQSIELEILFVSEVSGQYEGYLSIGNDDPRFQETSLRLPLSSQAFSTSVDLDLNDEIGNQEEYKKKGISSGDTISVQIFARELPLINGFSALLIFDQGFIEFQDNGFSVGSLFLGALPLTTSNDSTVEINVASISGPSSERDGLLGTALFTALTDFADSTIIGLTSSSFAVTNGSLQTIHPFLSVILSSELDLYGDFNSDNAVGFPDFIMFAQNFGKKSGDVTFEKRFDANDDGEIGFPDFLQFAQNFGKTVE